MQIRNFNQPEASPAAAPAEASRAPAAPAAPPAASAVSVPPEEGYAGAEMALLRARIEHLELVVETARSLMTSNQERLLRRLHDLPHEMMALTARMARYAPASEVAPTMSIPLRRVQ